jgi:ribA/ribD-fused uncharacterized protein
MKAKDVRSCEALINYLERGEQARYVLFWGHSAAPGGPVGKACFSQWYEAPFTLDGVGYATAEHYMMAEKARLFGDDAALQNVLTTSSPGAAKAAGRAVKGFDDAVWVSKRWDIVVRANVAKFAQHPALGLYLQQTGDRVLVEASPVDAIWGIGLAADDPSAEHPRAWKGLNLLGFALMEVRARISG